MIERLLRKGRSAGAYPLLPRIGVNISRTRHGAVEGRAYRAELGIPRDRGGGPYFQGRWEAKQGLMVIPCGG